MKKAVIQNFELFLYDKPLDEISRWLGGLELASSPYPDTGRKQSSMRQFSATDSIEKPALGTTQLLEFEGSNSVTIVRSLGLIDTLGVDDFISGPAEANYMKFRHSDDYERLPRVTDFQVYRSGQLIRSVLAHTGESRSQQNNWTFIEYDQPLSWEGPDPFSKGRLTGHQLVNFLQNLGLNFENFINHRHRKVIEFGPFIEGENLSQFQKEADVIAPPLSRLMSDDFFEQYADEDFEKTDIDRTKLKTAKFKD